MLLKHIVVVVVVACLVKIARVVVNTECINYGNPLEVHKHIFLTLILVHGVIAYS